MDVKDYLVSKSDRQIPVILTGAGCSAGPSD